jgi:hypothetical protein
LLGAGPAGDTPLLNDKYTTPSVLIGFINWYDQKPFIGLIWAG